MTRQLRQRVPGVVGVDVDTHSVEIARGLDSTGDIEYVTGDFLRADLGVESFDTVVSVAALHHMDTTTALTRMRSLLRPGGVSVVVGLARSRFPADLPLDLAATFASRLYRLKAWVLGAPLPQAMAATDDLPGGASAGHRPSTRVPHPAAPPVALLGLLANADRRAP